MGILSDFLRDARHGFRILRRQPVFAAVMLLTMAVGIGVNSVFFIILNSLLLRPLPVKSPEKLVVLATRQTGSASLHDLSYPDLLDLQAQGNQFLDVAGYELGFAGLTKDAKAERILAAYVTGNYFSMLGLNPYAGRLIEPQEGQKQGANPVLVLSYSYWQQRFNGDRSIIGQGITIDGQPVTVIGITPPDFRGTFSLARTEVYLAISQVQDAGLWTARNQRGVGSFNVIGRLSDGATIDQARAFLAVAAKRLALQYPASNTDISFELYREQYARPQPSAAESWPAIMAIFFALTMAIFLIASMNLSSLMQAHTNAREQELGIRSALGARGGRLLRQLTAENLIFSMAGGAIGAGLARLFAKFLTVVCTPVDVPSLFLDVDLDIRSLMFIFLISIASGLFLAVLVGRKTYQQGLNTVLHSGKMQQGGSLRQHRFRNSIIALQIAGSVVSLIISGLLIRSLIEARRARLGFDPRNVINLTMDVKEAGYSAEEGQLFFKKLLDTIRQTPGVDSAAFVYSVPFSHDRHVAPVYIEGVTNALKFPPELFYNIVSPGYFDDLRIRLPEGRDFDDRDKATAPRTAIISQGMADRFWRGQDPIGKTFRIRNSSNQPMQVIGVAENAKFISLTRNANAYFYVPLAQNYSSQITLQVRSSVSNAADLILRQIKSMEPNLPVFDVRTMETALDGSTGLFALKAGSTIAVWFGGLGLFLTVIGVYGVISYATGLRTREFGVRMALGATTGKVKLMVVREAAILIAAGAAIGVLAALGVSRFLSAILVGVSPNDFLSYSAATSVLVGVSLLAAYLPVRNAVRKNIMESLRLE